MSDAWRLPAAAGVTCAIYVLVYWTQNVPVWLLQTAIIGAAVPFEIVNLVHGVRILTAWMFGWWSIAVLLPATVFVYAINVSQRGWDAIDASFHIVVIGFLVSGPLAFHVIGLVLPERHRRSRFEWRVLLLAGFLSAVFNSVVYGLVLIPYDPPSAGLAWFAGHVVSQMLGLTVLLGIAMLFLRWQGQGPSD
jgi:hypothetical protein